MKRRKRQEERDRGRAAVGVIFSRLDEIEARELEYRRLMQTEGDAAARAVFPRPSPADEADEVYELVVICDRKIDNFLDALELWADTRRGSLAPEEKDERAIDAVYVSMFTKVSNLFGMVPSGAPGFVPELAAEGKRRGWGRR